MRNAVLGLCLAVLAMGAQAEDGPRGGLTVELNTVQEESVGCQLTFLVSSGLSQDIDRVVFETVLFDSRGAVDRLTLFDFGAVPAGTPRVRQFVVPNLACSNVGQILINGVHTCEAPGLDGEACGTNLEVRSRIDVELLG